MTTDTEDDGFTTVHQSAAFAGAGAGGVVRPDLPLTLSAAQAEIVALRGRVAELRDGLKCALALCDTPISRRRLGIAGDNENLVIARRALTNGGDHE